MPLDQSIKCFDIAYKIQRYFEVILCRHPPSPPHPPTKKTHVKVLKSNLCDIMQSDHCDEENANAVIGVSYLNQTLRQKIFVIVYCCCLSLHQLDQIRKDIYNNNNKERNLYIEPIRTISIVILT